ncbi:NADH-quinone oxidoreductase subunit C [Gramella jeungdoensis]|uniref:NADH-quinone oxidoreductase subunit C n=1 Tax=Gramella jeungdoensis TaxID=708091 RepID=A0ABT0YZR4_9FLAO|nr:NADH-quinone oxidoreductase subunit C [Gramella jeungdoensis]MCM8568392.1 NADH-quinone oxidoreductase subunit C [Gramella jeungdoensis]
MTNQELKDLITGWFAIPEAVQLEFSEEGSQFLNLSIHPDYLHETMYYLKLNRDTDFDYLYCLTGIDWEKELEVVYHLESTEHRHSLVVRTKTSDRETPVIDSVQDIWPTANFHEREVYDFFGIRFKNHPNMKRLFLAEDWEGFPLRKDYVDEVNMVVK